MKFSNILSFIAGIAIAYGAVIPENYDANELSANEELSNDIVVDAEAVSEVVISSDEEIEVDVDAEDVGVEDSGVEDSDYEETTTVITVFETSTIEVEPTSTVEPASIVEPTVEPTSTVVEQPTTTDVDEPTVTPLDLIPGPVTCTYKKKDTDAKFDIKSDNQIKCEGTSCTVEGKGAVVSDGIVTINAAGNYILQGKLQGQVRIEAGEKDYVHLILNDANIKSEEGPAVAALSAEKVTITLVGENALIDSENYVNTDDKQPNACLYAKTDLSINGEGSLDITGKFGTTLHCTKDLKLVSGNITVDAKNKGIQAKNSICIHEANVEVNSVNSALKVTNKTKADKGFVVIDNGNVTISTENDAIHAETHVTIYDGFIDIKKCSEGIEGQMIDILGGEFHITTNNDAINASYITAVKQPKGLPPPPPPSFDPNDPNGFPMGMGPHFGPESNDGSMYINIVGGKLYITAKDSQEIDGIDSNGILYVGGTAEIYVDLEYGKIYGDFAALDSDGDNVVAGKATVVAAAQSLSWEEAGEFMTEEERNNRPPPPPPPAKATGDIYQLFISMKDLPKQPAHTEFVLKDKDGNVIVSYAPECGYNTAFIISPKLVEGESYEFSAGSYVETVVPSKDLEGTYKSPSVDGF